MLSSEKVSGSQYESLCRWSVRARVKMTRIAFPSSPVSSEEERPAFNRVVVGSIPTPGDDQTADQSSLLLCPRGLRSCA